MYKIIKKRQEREKKREKKVINEGKLDKRTKIKIFLIDRTG